MESQQDIGPLFIPHFLVLSPALIGTDTAQVKKSINKGTGNQDLFLASNNGLV